MPSPIRPPHIKLGIQQTKPRGAAYQITGSESGIAFTNTAAVTLTLPKATVGEEFWFYVNFAGALTVLSVAPDVIGAKGAGASYASAAVGSFLWVKCFVAGKWTLAINSGFA